MNTSEKLLKAFTEICEEIVSDVYVITNGRSTLTATLDHNVATKLCEMMIKQSGNSDWVVAQIPNAIEFAYRHGYETAIDHVKAVQSGEGVEETAPEFKGELDAENSELRDGELQREEE